MRGLSGPPLTLDVCQTTRARPAFRSARLGPKSSLQIPTRCSGMRATPLSQVHVQNFYGAVDTGIAVAFMSEQTYLELGRMSAVCARGRGVNHDALRALLVDSYLPRVPVIRTGPSATDYWLPDVDDVRDADDVPHVQAARLIGAGAVYSHDKDLRRPGFAPADRDAYDQRVAHLSALSTRHDTEEGVGAGRRCRWRWNVGTTSEGVAPVQAQTHRRLGGRCRFSNCRDVRRTQSQSAASPTGRRGCTFRRANRPCRCPVAMPRASFWRPAF